MAIIIPLTQGQETIIDDEDWDLVKKYKWSAHYDPTTNGYYATTSLRTAVNKRVTAQMHRIIMNAPTNMEVDHKDLNGLNNQRHNLRLATRGQNSCNRRIPSNNISGHKGVYYITQTNKWRAQIRSNRHLRHLGYFGTKEEASEAYKNAAKEIHEGYDNSTSTEVTIASIRTAMVADSTTKLIISSSQHELYDYLDSLGSYIILETGYLYSVMDPYALYKVLA